MSTVNPISLPLLVRGAGISGVFCWKRFVNSGALLLEYPQAIPSATCHAQCVIHQGYAYNMLKNATLISELATSAKIWEGIVESEKIPYSRGVLYCFSERGRMDRMQSRIRQYKYVDTKAKFLVDDERLTSDNVLPDLESLEASDQSLPVGVNWNMFLDGGILRSKEMVLRPSQVVDRLVDPFRESVKLQTGSSSQIRGSREIWATGRKEFEKLSPREIETIDHWSIVLKGDLPFVNAFFPDLIFSVEEPEQRSNDLSIFSHKFDGETIWLLTSDLFEGEMNLTKQNVLKLTEVLSKLMDTFDKNKLQVKKLFLDLPDLGNLSSEDSIEWRCVMEGQIPTRHHVYVERMTLAPLMKEYLPDSWDNSRATHSKFSDELSQEPQFTATPDRWSDDNADFVDWEKFVADLPG